MLAHCWHSEVMATLYRKKNPAGNPVKSWYCAFRIPAAGGKTRQIHRSTGKQTKAEARIEAAALEAQALKDANASDDDKKAIMAKLTEAAELAVKNRLNPAAARKIIGEMMVLTGQENVADITTRKWFDDWLKKKESTTKKATAAFYKTSTKEFLEFIEDKADKHLDSITTADVLNYRDSVRDSGRVAKTCNHKLKALRSVFGDAVKHAILLNNPCAPIDTLVEDDSVQRKPFTYKEVGKLVKAAPSEDWKGVILLGAFAGLRLTDATRLEVGNIHMKRKVIHFVPRKTNRKKNKPVVEVPMHSELVSYFKNRKEKLSPFDGASVFDSLARVSAGGREGLSARFRRIMEAAKVERHLTRKTADGAARDNAKHSFHSLRHTFTSWLAKADVPEEVRMEMTGHTESTTHQKYTHQELERLSEAVDRLPSLGQS